jgi:hypothetical protein
MNMIYTFYVRMDDDGDNFGWFGPKYLIIGCPYSAY